MWKDAKEIPDEVIYSEYALRSKSGRPRKYETCKFCKARFSAREMRKHKPECKGKLQLAIAKTAAQFATGD